MPACASYRMFLVFLAFPKEIKRYAKQILVIEFKAIQHEARWCWCEPTVWREVSHGPATDILKLTMSALGPPER